MNKNAIKNYAIWARKELIEKVKTKAFTYGISENNITETDTVNGHLISETEKAQRKQLISHIRYNGYDQTIEEVAYTWFNRFIALRFMEVNGYLPTRYKVFSDTTPEIIKEAVHIDLRSVDKEKIYSYIENNNQEELYKYILISLCNELSTSLPKMFTEFEDYSILLFPDNLLRDGSVLNRMVTDIPEEDWKEQVQIIGSLYQQYISESKSKTQNELKKRKSNKNDIAAISQLFTPDWITRYMVENSLGRIWYEGYPSNIKDNWKYYIDEAEQEDSVKIELNKIKQEHAQLKLEDIKFIDPCMGSGHILVYAFEVFMQMYQEQGYTVRDAVRSIVENNIYGLDIDERASQLAYFSVMMKAREYDSRFLTRGVQPHVYEIVETNDFDVDNINCFDEYGHMNIAYNLYKCFYDAKEYGSLISPDFTLEELDLLEKDLVKLDSENIDDLAIQALLQDTVKMYRQLIAVCRTLITKYDVVVTNPPYMSCTEKQKPFVEEYYPETKADLCVTFIDRCSELLKEYGYQSMITMHSWMFLGSFEKFRKKIVNTKTIVNMAHLGARAFDEIGGEVVQTTAFTICDWNSVDYKGTYCRLIEPKSEMKKETLFLSKKQRYSISTTEFKPINGMPIAYWASKRALQNFTFAKPLIEFSRPRVGQNTGDNDRFLRLWYEIDLIKIGFGVSHVELENTKKKWIPYNKGGSFRRWYGNFDRVVNWENNGKKIKDYAVIRNHGKHWSRYIQNIENMCREGISWSDIASTRFGCRYLPEGFICDVKGSSTYPDDKYRAYIMAFLNSHVAIYYLQMLNPTTTFQVGNIGGLPFIFQNQIVVDKLADENVSLSSYDWDSYETSWDFKEDPLIRLSKGMFDITKTNATLDYYYGCVPEISSPIECTYLLWKGECNDQFKQLKENEEKLNRIFIDIYGLQDELTPEVEDKDVTVHCIYDTKEDIPESLKGSNYVLTKHDVIVSFISYAVGCMFGRYSLDKEGLAYAGGNWKDSFQEKTVYMWGEPTDKKEMMINTLNGWKKITFQPDTDNILPICDDEYFEDDIVGKFIEFVKAVYGEESLNANLAFIADALDNPGNTPKEVIRNYFLNDFFKDHCNTYSVTGSGKRPIYWLFDAGKKNSFKALIYMHRYDKDTIARIRTDYIHPTQRRISSMIEMKENGLDSLSKSEQIKANKEIKHLKEQEIELRQYEEKIHVLADERIDIDLDDGVKVNYAKFADVLAKIK